MEKCAQSCAQSERLHVSLVQSTWNEDDLDMTSKSGDEQISMKEACGPCEGSAE